MQMNPKLAENAQLNILMLKSRHQATQTTANQTMDSRLRVRTSSSTAVAGQKFYVAAVDFMYKTSTKHNLNPDIKIIKHSILCNIEPSDLSVKNMQS